MFISLLNIKLWKLILKVKNVIQLSSIKTNACLNFNNSQETSTRILSKMWKCIFGNQLSPVHYFILKHAFYFNQPRPCTVDTSPSKASKLHLSLEQSLEGPDFLLHYLFSSWKNFGPSIQEGTYASESVGKGEVEQVAGKAPALSLFSSPSWGSLWTEKVRKRPWLLTRCPKLRGNHT